MSFPHRTPEDPTGPAMVPLNMQKSRNSNVAPATARMMRHVSAGTPLDNPMRGELLPGVELMTTSPNSQVSHAPSTPNRDYSNPPPAHQNRTPTQQQQPNGSNAFHRKSIGDWEFMKTIGSGSMGKVKLAKHRITNEICAVKVVTRAAKVWQRQHQNDPPSNDPNEINSKKKEFDKEVGRDKRTIREAALGKILYHPFICRLYEMYPMSNHYYMLFEYVQGGQMLDYIVSHGSLKEIQARKFCRGIASALDYCHSNNIVHRDLKIENIMINTQGEIKIIDFGLSNLFDRENLLKTYCGSLYFAAPELLSAHPYVGPEVDIWSFGVVLYVLVCGKVPFDDKSVNNLHEKIKKGNVEYPNHLSNECVSLLQRMLVVNPTIRGNIREIINHPWMNKGYQGPVKNYLPSRKPIEFPLNQEVIKLIVELDLSPSPNHVNLELNKILRSQIYQTYVDNWYAKSKRQMYDPKLPDPTTGIHPIISLYYLVDEMMERKKLKEIKEDDHNDDLLKTPQFNQNPIFNAASNQSSLPHESHHRVVTQPIPSQYQHNTNQRVDPFADQPQQPQQPTTPFNLQPPQAAHTSPHQHAYDRPSPIIETNLDFQTGTSPPPAQQSPIDESFGNSILRKLSIKKDDVRRVGSVKVTTKEKQQQQQQQQQLLIPNPQRKKSHQRAASAYTASAFVSDKLPPVPMTKNTSMVAQQQQQQQQQQPEKNYHPSARAKSLGHSRKYSLNIPGKTNYFDNNAPPLPQIQMNQFNDKSSGDNEFFEEEDNSSVQFSSKMSQPIKLSDKEIIEQYERASPGSMPSIEYPKTLFLKGFFSVQTTSTKPLPVIRYGIISVLPQLGVQFVEVKGGFICVHYPSIVVESPVKSASPLLRSPGKSNENTLDELIHSNEVGEDYDNNTTNSSLTTAYNNNSNNPPSEIPQLLSTPQKGHRRKFSLGNSILSATSQQQQQQQPLSTASTRNKLSISTTNQYGTTGGNNDSVIPTTPAPANLIRQLNDDSTESLTYDETTGASDMLISSRVEQQKVNSTTPINNGVKKPLKFEIHIVKVPLVGLYGIQFKKVGGNTWLYKSLASEILSRLNL